MHEFGQANGMEQFVPGFQPFNMHDQSHLIECAEMEGRYLQEAPNGMEAPMENPYEQFRAPRRVVQSFNPMMLTKSSKNEAKYQKSNYVTSKQSQKLMRQQPEIIVREILKPPPKESVEEEPLPSITNENTSVQVIEIEVHESDCKADQSLTSVELETPQAVSDSSRFNTKLEQQLSEHSEPFVPRLTPRNANSSQAAENSSECKQFTEVSYMSQAEGEASRCECITPEILEPAQGPPKDPLAQSDPAADSKSVSKNSKHESLKQTQKAKPIPKISKKKAKLLARKKQKPFQLHTEIKSNQKKSPMSPNLSPIVFKLPTQEKSLEVLSKTSTESFTTRLAQGNSKISPKPAREDVKATNPKAAPMMSKSLTKLPLKTLPCDKTQRTLPEVSPKVSEKPWKLLNQKFVKLDSARATNEADSSTKNGRLELPQIQAQSADTNLKCITPNRASSIVLAPANPSRSMGPENALHAAPKTSQAKPKLDIVKIAEVKTNRKSSLIEEKKTSEIVPSDKPSKTVFTKQAKQLQPSRSLDLLKKPLNIPFKNSKANLADAAKLEDQPTSGADAELIASEVTGLAERTLGVLDSIDIKKSEPMLFSENASFAKLAKNEIERAATVAKSSKSGKKQPKPTAADATMPDLQKKKLNMGLEDTKLVKVEKSDLKGMESNQKDFNLASDEADPKTNQLKLASESVGSVGLKKPDSKLILQGVASVEPQKKESKLPAKSAMSVELKKAQSKFALEGVKPTEINKSYLGLALENQISEALKQNELKLASDGAEQAEPQPEHVSQGNPVPGETEVELKASQSRSKLVSSQDKTKNNSKKSQNIAVATPSTQAPAEAAASELGEATAKPIRLDDPVSDAVESEPPVQPFRVNSKSISKKKYPKLTKLERKALRREATKAQIELQAAQKEKKVKENEQMTKTKDEPIKEPECKKKKRNHTSDSEQSEKTANSSSEEEAECPALKEVGDPLLRRKLMTIIQKIINL